MDEILSHLTDRQVRRGYSDKNKLLNRIKIQECHLVVQMGKAGEK